MCEFLHILEIPDNYRTKEMNLKQVLYLVTLYNVYVKGDMWREGFPTTARFVSVETDSTVK